MECRSCGAQLPPEAQTCPECGAPASRLQQLPQHRRKALHGVIAAVAAVLVIAGVLLWYFITTDRETNNEVKEAINDMRFSDAEVRMGSVHIFQPSDLELRKTLIAAGHEAEARDNVALLQRISDIRAAYDASELAPYRGVIDQLEANAEPDLYISLCSDYEAGKYEDVIAGFETLASRGYERSRDYLFLTRAHLSDAGKHFRNARRFLCHGVRRLQRKIRRESFPSDSGKAPSDSLRLPFRP
jgi:ribosomal protein L40E